VLGIDTRDSFGNTGALFVPDPTWYREESKESDGATQYGGGLDTRRASTVSRVELNQKKGNETVTGVGTFCELAQDTFEDSFVPQHPSEPRSIVRFFSCGRLLIHHCYSQYSTALLQLPFYYQLCLPS
jgi:hypothetical protein